MEFKQDGVLHDKDDKKTRDALKLDNQMHAKDNATGWESGKNSAHDAPSEDINASAEVNMEALLTSDDVIRAGGFGARDDISSFLPVASDSTDFEATIRDARGYEEPQGNICRPGLGWRDSKETE